MIETFDSFMFVLFVCFTGITFMIIIVVLLLIKYFKILSNNFDKQNNKIKELDSKQNKFDAFLIPTYNNSIRIAKKLNVYYCYNKEDYEKHKIEKTL